MRKKKDKILKDKKKEKEILQRYAELNKRMEKTLQDYKELGRKIAESKRNAEILVGPMMQYALGKHWKDYAHGKKKLSPALRRRACNRFVYGNPPSAFHDE